METPENEIFRDSISTITEEGKRAWVFPKNLVVGFTNTENM
ncbi:type cbb3 cytochrome oxidase biogenesis protein CcoG [Jejuia pallidilutea]|uniref:Type cbb3 cytochrome oxidase biogenesis protein CcoG n=1 Tax=Jejuia pallidilutea TaxID=504487 RepID=A0A090VYU2_9FLAO|nr:type cbb3 cytochrome oxidase biogenesis protein CcoG [Jejuia pallidilutea]GAL69861.1 type cbb3 cytochrome oxidase biogenesis protein CcoG [Jejuia pallidilutea]